MRQIIMCAAICALALRAAAQELPKDYLTADFHKERRAALRAELPPNSVAVLFANPERNRANDVDYKYHQDPDFYYLTGYKEPNSLLLIFAERQQAKDSSEYDEIIYVQPRDPQAEQWNGKRLGVEGVRSKLGFDKVYETAEFHDSPIDFGAFDQVLFFDFKNDYRDTRSKADLFDLILTFKEKANYPSDYNPTRQRLYDMIRNTDEKNSEQLVYTLGRYLNYYKELREDRILNDFAKAKDPDLRNELKAKVVLELKSNNLNSFLLPTLMNKLREVKTPEELKLLKKAVEISAVGQVEVMKAMHPQMSESEIQGVHEFVYKKYGAEHEGYPSIVGAGGNGCILHYIENNKTRVGEELVLMDLGAEYHGYTADVTRTIPANGKFSPEQKKIYDIVYKAQEAGIKASIVGAPFKAPGEAAREVIARELLKLGIISEEGEVNKYFPHGTSHYLGLDVHDRGTYQAFKENTVITVEPGIYIPEGSDCHKKWWGIAVRIEDDILITKEGPVNLSERAPRTVEAIETVMEKASPLEDFVLPGLD